jgi:transposase
MHNSDHRAQLTIVPREELAKRVVEGRLRLAKWVRRYREQATAGLRDRTSRPDRSSRSTLKERIMEIERLRRQRWTAVRIAEPLGLSAATASRVLRHM